MKRIFSLFSGLAFALSIGAPAHADEASVKRAFEAAMRTQVESVTRTSFLGMYEVFAGGQILYTDENVTAVFAGPLLDPKTMTNVTAERIKKLTAVSISDLPLDLAVKTVRGNGSRKLVTFEDPNCGYCRRIAEDLSKLDNVTVYTFLYAILSPDSVEKSNQVWCSKDRSKAWFDLMLSAKKPTARGDCATPVQQVQELGKKYAINGTPTLIFESGERVPGAISLPEIERRLAQASK